MTTEKFAVRNRWTGEVQFTATIEVTPDMLPSVKLGLAVRWARETGADLTDADLTGADLTGADLYGANLTRANLTRADLTDANLTGADLTDANLTRANLTDANLTRADLTDANLTRADLTDANLTRANLRRANLTDADLTGADLTGADLYGANLTRANLTRADLTDADLTDANLTDADLTDANLRPIIADFRFILSSAHSEVPALIAALKAGKVNGSTYEGECACLVGTLENAGATGLPHVASSPAERWFLTIREGDKPGDDTAGGFAAAKALEWALDYCRDTGLTAQVAA